MAPAISSDACALALDFLQAEPSNVAAMLAIPDAPAQQWPRKLLPLASLNEALASFIPKGLQPACTVCCTMGSSHDHGTPEGGALRMDAWRALISRSQGLPAGMLLPASCNPFIAPADIPAGLPGTVLAMDGAAALVNALLSVERFRRRDQVDGCTVIYAGIGHIQVMLTFKGRISALYEQHLPIPEALLEKDLKELRLNWLPTEKVRMEGGHGCICGELPEEAESFVPTWIAGPSAEAFQPFGRMFNPSGDSAFDCCLGALLAVRPMQGGSF